MRRVLSALLIVAALVSLPSRAQAQNGTIAPVPFPVYTDTTGAICSSCLLRFYTAGTSTPLAVYSDVTLLTVQSQPITLNAAGRTPLQVYLSANSYKYELTTSGGSTVFTADNVSAVPGTVTGISNTGDVVFQVDTDSNGSNAFNFLNGSSTTKATLDESGNFQIDGNLTVGDATAADKAVLFDGITQDFYVGLDDSATSLVIGRGTALGTTPALAVSSAGAITVTGTATHVGDLLFTDATYDIGKTAATRARDLFLSRDAVVGGTLTVSGTSITATGGQIVFPGTQVPAAGVNTLDDYEEGTWSPTDGSGAALTYTSIVGQYVKIGQLVTATASITFPATGSGANATIANLPFTANASGTAIYGCTINYSTEPTLRALNVQPNATTTLAYDFSGVLITNATLTTDVVRFTCVYRATN